MARKRTSKLTHYLNNHPKLAKKILIEQENRYNIYLNEIKNTSTTNIKDFKKITKESKNLMKLDNKIENPIENNIIENGIIDKIYFHSEQPFINSLENVDWVNNFSKRRKPCILKYYYYEKYITDKISKDLRYLNLSNCGLYNICWQDIPPTVIYLDLSKNNISHLDFKNTNTDHLVNLKTLILSYNKIENYVDNSHDYPSTLQNLHLDNNELKEIWLNYWAKREKSKNLRNIYLQNNKLSFIHFPDNLINLKKIDLSNNLITSLRFPFIPNLTTINITGNLLTDFCPNKNTLFDDVKQSKNTPKLKNIII